MRCFSRTLKYYIFQLVQTLNVLCVHKLNIIHTNRQEHFSQETFSTKGNCQADAADASFLVRESISSVINNLPAIVSCILPNLDTKASSCSAQPGFCSRLSTHSTSIAWLNSLFQLLGKLLTFSRNYFQRLQKTLYRQPSG